jgi:hypothetical protein
LKAAYYEMARNEAKIQNYFAEQIMRNPDQHDSQNNAAPEKAGKEAKK